MADDLVERLSGNCPSIPAMRDAAKEIKRLRAEIAELRARAERAERRIADAPCGYVAISLATDFVMVSEIDAIRVQKIARGKRVALVVVE